MMRTSIPTHRLPQALRLFCRAFGLVVLLIASPLVSHAAIVASGFHSGRVEMFDEQTNAQSTLAILPGAQLSGIAYNPFNDSLYVSALNQGGIYRLNARTGAVHEFNLLGIGPGGLAISNTGDIYVTNFGAAELRVYDSLLSTLKSTIALPDGTVSSGVGFAANGDVLIATLGAGVYRYDGSNLNLFINNPLAAAQISRDAQNNIYIGHGLGFSDNAFKYNDSGDLLALVTVPNSLISSVNTGSVPGTSPSGIAIDADGNLIVSVLGRSNPGDPDGERGGILKFDSAGNNISTIVKDSFAFSGVTIVPTAIPEPSAISVLGLFGLAALRIRRRN